MSPYLVAGAHLDAGVVEQAENNKDQADHRYFKELVDRKAGKADSDNKGSENNDPAHQRDRSEMDLAGAGLVEDVEGVEEELNDGG